MISTMGLHLKDDDTPSATVVPAHDSLTAPYVRVHLDKSESVTVFPSREYLETLINVLTVARDELLAASAQPLPVRLEDGALNVTGAPADQLESL